MTEEKWGYKSVAVKRTGKVRDLKCQIIEEFGKVSYGTSLSPKSSLGVLVLVSVKISPLQLFRPPRLFRP